MQERHARDISANCTNSVSQYCCWFCLIVTQLLLHCTYKSLMERTVREKQICLPLHMLIIFLLVSYKCSKLLKLIL